MNPLGIHFVPQHQGEHHYQFIRDMQPGIFKLCGDSMPDVQQMADGFANAPNALHYWRNIARSEQQDFLWREPERAAHQHVTEWHADIQERYRQARERGLVLPPIEQIRITGVNEPVIELFPRQEDMSNYDAWWAMMMERTPLLDTYMATFGYEANRLGYGAGLGNLPSGQPANKKPGEYATFDWFPKTRKLLEATRGKNAYVSHEYWRAESGPEGHADWHAWRFMHLNVDCDIDILENGVDQYITKDKQPLDPRGWHGHEGLDATAYVDQHRRYLARACTDSRFRCATPFTLDGNNMWESFWIEYCMAEMVALSKEVRVSTPSTIHIPAVGTGAQPATLYVSATAGLNLRDAPGTGKILAKLPYGSQVTMIAPDATNPAWFNVRYENTEGYAYSHYLSKDKPDAPGQPTPAPQPVPSGDNWTRSRAFVERWEGEYQNNPADKGNWTGCEVGKGENKGTKYGISACSYPDLDIRNLTMDEADAIYFRDYWQASNAASLPWPYCLLAFDTAVLHGVGTSLKWQQEAGNNPNAFAAKRLRVYTKLDNWREFGAGWVNRVADLLLEASKA